MFYFVCFFFQAEDGIRDFHVTGVQTCALPICQLYRYFTTALVQGGELETMILPRFFSPLPDTADDLVIGCLPGRRNDQFHQCLRSEERRVGKECRSRWTASDQKKTAREQIRAE